MTNLTDKWKKGELPFGWYYIKIADIVFIDFFEGKVWKNKKDKYIDEVLEQVPNFEQWQANENYIDYLKQCISVYESKEKQHTDDAIAYNELAEENKELKEILERHKKATAKAQIRSCDLEIINAQLKELLKECRDEIEYLRKHYKGNIDHLKNNTRLDKEINQVLGEE